jgi:glycerate dehydrogenase
MKGVFLDFATLGSDRLDVAELTALLPDLQFFDSTPTAELAKRVRDAEFVFANKVRLTKEVIDAAPGIRFIGLTATGVDNVDLHAAGERGIAVCNIRAYCTQAVVEHVFAVLLGFTHSIGRYRRSVRAGDWQKASNFCMLDFPVRELSAMTIGIVGHGELGGGIAKMARHFGMTVLIAARPGGPPTDGRTTFTELLKQSDVISLHCPLTDATRSLIGAAELAAMKPTAILINTARGGLVDSAALAAALESGTIAAAAIDVLAQEPPVTGDPLLDYAGDNLILTPHIAWATIEARQNAVSELAANVAAFIGGRKRNRVV